MNSSRLFLTTAVATCIIFVGLYVAAFSYQFGAPIPAEYEVYRWRLLKEHLAKKVEGKRILLVGDSSVLFGMDSGYAEKQLGRPVINLALHGGLPLDVNLSMATGLARSSDIVVMPIIWVAYGLDYRIPNDWFRDQIVAWGHSDFDELSFRQKLRMMSAFAPSILYKNMRVKQNRVFVLKENPLRKLKSDTETLEDYYKLASQQSTFSYSYLNINEHGDMQHNNCGVHVEAQTSGTSAAVNENTLHLLLNTVRTLNARGVKVFISAPVNVDNSETRTPGYQATINNLWEILGRNGLPLLGEPTDYFFPPKAFFDTNYHLNCDYTTARTEILIKALKPLL